MRLVRRRRRNSGNCFRGTTVYSEIFKCLFSALGFGVEGLLPLTHDGRHMTRLKSIVYILFHLHPHPRLHLHLRLLSWHVYH